MDRRVLLLNCIKVMIENDSSDSSDDDILLQVLRNKGNKKYKLRTHRTLFFLVFILSTQSYNKYMFYILLFGSL